MLIGSFRFHNRIGQAGKSEANTNDHGYGLTNMDSYGMFERLTDAGANVIVISNDSYFEDYDNVFFVPRCDEVISPFAILETMKLTP